MQEPFPFPLTSKELLEDRDGHKWWCPRAAHRKRAQAVQDDESNQEMLNPCCYAPSITMEVLKGQVLLRDECGAHYCDRCYKARL